MSKKSLKIKHKLVDIIRDKIEEKGISHREFSRLIGYSNPQYTHNVLSKSLDIFFPESKIKEICKVLKLDVEFVKDQLVLSYKYEIENKINE
jgi:predicted XRE-type DNA-binding protein